MKHLMRGHGFFWLLLRALDVGSAMGVHPKLLAFSKKAFVSLSGGSVVFEAIDLGKGDFTIMAWLPKPPKQ